MDKAPPTPRPLLKRIFISPDEPRLRAGWRLLAQTILQYTLIVVVGIPLFLILQPDITARSSYQMSLPDMVATAAPIMLSVYLARRYIDKRSFASLGLRLDRAATRHLLAGIGIGGAQMLLVYLIEWAAGWLHFTGFAWQSSDFASTIPLHLEWIIIWLIVGFYEEIVSRGYHLQNIEAGLNPFWGVVLSSIIFGLMHLPNPNASRVSSLSIAIISLLLAFAYLRTRSLWLPVGLHIGWNFFQGTVFGFPVSGNTMPGLLLHTISGPPLLTGGEFGPEAGLVALPALVFGALLVWRLPKTEDTKPDDK